MKTPRGLFLAVVAALACWLLLSFCSGTGSGPAKTAGTAPPAEAQGATAAGPTSAQPAETAAKAPDVPETEDPSLQPQAAAGAVQGVPAPTNTAPIIAVANYFTDLPGIDVAALKSRQRERFLQRVNSEMCTCGCKNDTLAHCYVNDQRCPVVKGMVQKVYEEAKAGS